jgi:hypothetical protein
MRFVTVIRRYLPALGIASGVLLLLFGLVLLARPFVLDYVLDKIQTKLRDKYATALTWEKAEVEGLTGVHFTALRLVPQGQDTLLSMQNLQASVRFWPLFVGELQLYTLNLNNGIVRFRQTASRDNVSRFLKRKPAKPDPSETPEIAVPAGQADFSGRVARVFNQFFGYLPADAEWERITVDVLTRNDTLIGALDKVQIHEGKLQAGFRLNDDQWQVGGVFDPIAHSIDINIARTDSAVIPLHWLRDSLGLQIGFSQCRIKLIETNESGERQVQTATEFRDLKLYHKRLNDKFIVFRKVGLDYSLHFGRDYVELDSTSTVTLNEINARLFFRMEAGVDTFYRFTFDTGLNPSQTLFTALPDGVCEGLKGIKTNGKLQFQIVFELNSSKPDSLKLEGGLRSTNFRIEQMGRQDLRMLNADFTYHPFRGGRGKLQVGPSNPDFIPLEQISPYLKQAVLSSEDGGFYYHNGFYADAIRLATIENIKARRFKRGGSTISMQLVKNVFLTHRKNMARKLEEALMVWLIESQHLTSKDRMLEVYMNIIEWGPNVYGAKEAARFYFSKTPAALAPEEAIFLAMIIPQPNAYYYYFDSTGHLKPFVEGYYKLLGRKMVQAELLTENEVENFSFNVALRGRAQDRLKIRERGERPDPSSLEYIEQEMDRELGLDNIGLDP